MKTIKTNESFKNFPKDFKSKEMTDLLRWYSDYSKTIKEIILPFINQFDIEVIDLCKDKDIKKFILIDNFLKNYLAGNSELFPKYASSYVDIFNFILKNQNVKVIDTPCFRYNEYNYCIETFEYTDFIEFEKYIKERNKLWVVYNFEIHEDGKIIIKMSYLKNE